MGSKTVTPGQCIWYCLYVKEAFLSTRKKIVKIPRIEPVYWQTLLYKHPLTKNYTLLTLKYQGTSQEMSIKAIIKKMTKAIPVTQAFYIFGVWLKTSENYEMGVNSGKYRNFPAFESKGWLIIYNHFHTVNGTLFEWSYWLIWGLEIGWPFFLLSVDGHRHLTGRLPQNGWMPPKKGSEWDSN